MIEGRNFIGIEKNENTELFKKEPIDYIDVTIRRLKENWKNVDKEKRKYIKNINIIELISNGDINE
jgi:hypothetical protein